MMKHAKNIDPQILGGQLTARAPALAETMWENQNERFPRWSQSVLEEHIQGLFYNLSCSSFAY